MAKTINVQTGEVVESVTNSPAFVETTESVQEKRSLLYPPLTDLADALYWNSKGDDSRLTAYYAACDAVKTKYPKPEAE